MLGHVHVEDAFDDWAQQPSLPRRLSRLGPGVCWYDIDGDGWEEPNRGGCQRWQNWGCIATRKAKAFAHWKARRWLRRIRGSVGLVRCRWKEKFAGRGIEF